MRDKQKKFIELGEKRVEKALTILRLIKNLSNRNHYDYDETQANKIIKALDVEMRELKASFRKGVTKGNSFKL